LFLPCLYCLAVVVVKLVAGIAKVVVMGVGMIIVVDGSGSGSDGGSGNMIVGTEIAAAVMTAAVALSWFLLMCSKLPWQL